MNEKTTFRQYLNETGYSLVDYDNQVLDACIKVNIKYRNIDTYYARDIEEAYNNGVPVNECASTIMARFDDEFEELVAEKEPIDFKEIDYADNDEFFGEATSKNVVYGFSRNSLGVSFKGKFGTMRKDTKWVIYDERFKDGIIDIQSDSRFGEIDLNKGKMVLSAAHSFANYIALFVDIKNGKATKIDLEPEIIEQLSDAVSNRKITDHRFDTIIRNHDVTDEEIMGESTEVNLVETSLRDLPTCKFCIRITPYKGQSIIKYATAPAHKSSIQKLKEMMENRVNMELVKEIVVYPDPYNKIELSNEPISDLDESTEVKNDTDDGLTDGESFTEWKKNVFRYLDKRIDTDKIKELGKYVNDFIKQEYDAGEPSWFNVAESVLNYARFKYPDALKDRSYVTRYDESLNVFNNVTQKLWSITFNSDTEANEEYYYFADDGGWDSVLDMCLRGNTIYVVDSKQAQKVVNEWFGDKAELIELSPEEYNEIFYGD